MGLIIDDDKMIWAAIIGAGCGLGDCVAHRRRPWVDPDRRTGSAGQQPVAPADRQRGEAALVQSDAGGHRSFIPVWIRAAIAGLSGRFA
jgi:hypothetical protein